MNSIVDECECQINAPANLPASRYGTSNVEKEIVTSLLGGGGGGLTAVRQPTLLLGLVCRHEICI
jgi:hypothetical protein